MTTPTSTPEPATPTTASTSPVTSSPAAVDTAHADFGAFLEQWLTHGPVERVFHLGELAKRAEAWLAHLHA